MDKKTQCFEVTIPWTVSGFSTANDVFPSESFRKNPIYKKVRFINQINLKF